MAAILITNQMLYQLSYASLSRLCRNHGLGPDYSILSRESYDLERETGSGRRESNRNQPLGRLGVTNLFGVRRRICGISGGATFKRRYS